MTLILGARDITKDIDAYIDPPSEPVRRAVERVAEDQELASDWLNDVVKGSCVCAATAYYMLALKVIAAQDWDRKDVQLLAAYLDIQQVSELLAIVERYIPETWLIAKHRYFAESCELE